MDVLEIKCLGTICGVSWVEWVRNKTVRERERWMDVVVGVV